MDHVVAAAALVAGSDAKGRHAAEAATAERSSATVPRPWLQLVQPGLAAAAVVAAAAGRAVRSTCRGVHAQ